MNTQTTYSFFLVTIPGLEELAKIELEQKSKNLGQEIFDIEKSSGGVSFKTKNIYTGFFVNIYLKIPTRILLRIKDFKVRDFPKLYNKLKTINWNEFIPGVIPDLNFSSHESKIFDERKVLKCLEDAIKNYQIGSPPKLKHTQKTWIFKPCVFIRIVNDLCTVSIDTTGERLDRRGVKLQTTHAPMRESLAAGLYYFTKQYYPNINSIFDPMCGSGTILLEAHNFYKFNNRNFVYQDMPFTPLKMIKEQESQQPNIAGQDISQEAISAATQNLRSIKVDINELDIFLDNNKREEAHYIINPPYNKRIKTETDANTFINKMIQHITKHNDPLSISLIVPKEVVINGTKDYKTIEGPSVNNGGIWTRFYLLKKEPIKLDK